MSCSNHLWIDFLTFLEYHNAHDEFFFHLFSSKGLRRDTIAKLRRRPACQWLTHAFLWPKDSSVDWCIVASHWSLYLGEKY
uniref:Uncharacterized protein n=1 Tax=Dulem virus 225 TaxID=3145702 RepID=A0AAU8B0X6_9VIRU